MNWVRRSRPRVPKGFSPAMAPGGQKPIPCDTTLRQVSRQLVPKDEPFITFHYSRGRQMFLVNVQQKKEEKRERKRGNLSYPMNSDLAEVTRTNEDPASSTCNLIAGSVCFGNSSQSVI